jgi:hypothetical protein
LTLFRPNIREDPSGSGWNARVRLRHLLLPSIAEGVIGADSSEVGPSQNMKPGNPLTMGVALPMSPSTPYPPDLFLHSARAAVPLGPPIDTRPSPISIDLVWTTEPATLVTLEKVLGRGSRSVDSLELQPSMSNGSPSHILEDSFHPSNFYEMTRGGGIINEVMETLIPSLHEIPEPQALHTFKGKEFIKATPEASCSLPSTTSNHPSGGKRSFIWSKGFGCELSPLKTRSARKRAEVCLKEQVTNTSFDYEHGALRGIKSLACLK